MAIDRFGERVANGLSEGGFEGKRGDAAEVCDTEAAVAPRQMGHESGFVVEARVCDGDRCFAELIFECVNKCGGDVGVVGSDKIGGAGHTTSTEDCKRGGASKKNNTSKEVVVTFLFVNELFRAAGGITDESAKDLDDTVFLDRNFGDQRLWQRSPCTKQNFALPRIEVQEKFGKLGLQEKKRLCELLVVAAGQRDVVEKTVQRDLGEKAPAFKKNWVDECGKEDATENRALSCAAGAFHETSAGTTVPDKIAWSLVFQGKNAKELVGVLRRDFRCSAVSPPC